jgi:hypothetical protein
VINDYKVQQFGFLRLDQPASPVSAAVAALCHLRERGVPHILVWQRAELCTLRDCRHPDRRIREETFLNVVLAGSPLLEASLEQLDRVLLKLEAQAKKKRLQRAGVQDGHGNDEDDDDDCDPDTDEESLEANIHFYMHPKQEEGNGVAYILGIGVGNL